MSTKNRGILLPRLNYYDKTRTSPKVHFAQPTQASSYNNNITRIRNKASGIYKNIYG